MSYLTEKDIEILRRLPITLAQRQGIEYYWSQNKEERTVSFSKIGQWLIGPITVGLLAAGYLTKRPELINSALVPIYILIIFSAPIAIIILASFAFVQSLSKEQETDNIFLRRTTLLSLDPKKKRLVWFYKIVIVMPIIFLLAILGYPATVTAFILAQVVAHISFEKARKTTKDYLDRRFPSNVSAIQEKAIDIRFISP